MPLTVKGSHVALRDDIVSFIRFDRNAFSIFIARNTLCSGEVALGGCSHALKEDVKVQARQTIQASPVSLLHFELLNHGTPQKQALMCSVYIQICFIKIINTTPLMTRGLLIKGHCQSMKPCQRLSQALALLIL